ncbi:unnamed protein product [Ectocarpus sp. CCAP 1310/34]|nr:unnamed protein product [Ectocarpus sp. CCAP 1310/34]
MMVLNFVSTLDAAVRIFYIDSSGFLRTHLLAVKLFRPAPSLGKVTGKVVLKWFLQVLGQHGIPIERLAGAVTDGGGDVRTGIGQVATRAWCGPHMLNRVIIDGTGMANTANQSKNLSCRGLMEICKKVVQHVNRSQGFKIELEDTLEKASDGKRWKAKLSQAVSQRWISLCKMLLRILEQWVAIDKVYASNREKFPLGDLRREMEEVYSMLSEFKAVIEYSQTTHEATAQKALEMTVDLLTYTLDPAERLRVYHVVSIGAEGDTTKYDDIEHEDLTPIGRNTRVALRKALVARFLPRYGRELDAGGHLFDRTMLLSPNQRKLRYVDALRSSAAKEGDMRSSSAIKAKIKEEVTDLLVAAIEAIRATAPSDGGVESTSSASGDGNDDHRRRRRRFLDDDDEGSDSDMDATPVEEDPRKEAEAMMKEWLAAQIPPEERTENGAEYWRLHGKKHPFALRLVAQAVYGVPASAGVVERDFSIADLFMPRKRASLDPAYLEMQLYLRAHFDSIPMDIPKLDDASVAAAIPDRFRDPQAVEEVRVLDFTEEEKEVGVFDFVPDEEGDFVPDEEGEDAEGPEPNVPVPPVGEVGGGVAPAAGDGQSTTN